MAEIDWFPEAAARFPSSPVWHGGEGALYWSDIDACRLYRLRPADGAVETVLDDGRPVGALVPQADGSLLLFRDRGNVVAFRDGGIAETVVPDIADFRKTRYASAAADAAGRVVCSVLSDSFHQVRYMLLDRGGRLSTLCETTGVPAGIAFADGGGAVLAANSYPTRPDIFRAPYDASAQEPLGEPLQKIADYLQLGRPAKGVPAGLAVASDGSVVAAVSGDSAIERLAPTGGVLLRMPLPVRRPIGLCFGGEALDVLYVTTAGAHRRGFDGEHAGELAAVRGFPVSGAAPFLAKIGLPDDASLPDDSSPQDAAPAVAESEGSDGDGESPAADGESVGDA